VFVVRVALIRLNLEFSVRRQLSVIVMVMREANDALEQKANAGKQREGNARDAPDAMCLARAHAWPPKYGPNTSPYWRIACVASDWTSSGAIFEHCAVRATTAA
jgi:hypothetical protein